MILRVFGDETYFDCIRCAVLYVTFHVIEFLFPIEYMTGQNVTGKLSVNMMSLYECITTCIRRMATMLLVLPPTRSPIIAASNCKSTRQANENAWTIFHNSAYRVEKFVDKFAYRCTKTTSIRCCVIEFLPRDHSETVELE